MISIWRRRYAVLHCRAHLDELARDESCLCAIRKPKDWSAMERLPRGTMERVQRTLRLPLGRP